MASPNKRCNRCGVIKSRSEFHVRRNRSDGVNHVCRACDVVLDRQRSLRYRYGITEEEYLTLLADQGGGCAVCGEPPNKKRLHIDHDHATGRIRGLLCFKCNCAIGYFGDSRERMLKAVAYLDADTGRSVPMDEVARRARREFN